MQKEIKELFPEWTKKEEMENIQSLCLSDDIDSLFSCIILKKLFKQLSIDAFYSFNQIYKTDTKIKSIVGIDMDLTGGRCWGNHVTLLSAEDKKNKKCANLNTVLDINRDNYFNKFAGSTLIQVLSRYNIGLNNMSKEQLEVLVSVDTAFKQYYFNKDLFKKYYNDILQYPMFEKILKEHDKNYFYNIIKEYGLHEKIYIDDNGKLNTNIRLDKLGELFPNLSFVLPKKEFYFVKEYKDIGQATYRRTKKGLSNKKIFSLAVTNKNFVKYSVA
ncbi:hypothetical protein G7A79_19170 [Coprococcus sp. MSK.21.13]|nr:hypothetical protein [Bacteroidales bacterium MSK.15.36]NSJ91254.1 hypothetical protein [Coprococcus sp. MSK.21.13]